MTQPVQSFERGTVLLTTLLIMTIMAAITVALLDDIRLAVKRTINVQAYAQADWQMRGAEDFITAYLRTDFRVLDPQARTVLLQSAQPVVLPTPGGTITLTLKDASHCFNLNSVVTEQGTQNGTVRLIFIALAQALGLPENQSVFLASALVDWQDADQQQSAGGAEDGTYLRRDPPFRTADTALRGPEEMRALDGMDEDLWDLFRPFVCTGPPGEFMPVNVNTLGPERVLLLAAALGGPDALPMATQILSQRPPGGYTQAALNQTVSTLALGDGVNTEQRITHDVQAVFVEVVTQVGPTERVRSFRFDGVDDDPVLTYRGWGRESFRPEIKTDAERDARP